MAHSAQRAAVRSRFIADLVASARRHQGAASTEQSLARLAPRVCSLLEKCQAPIQDTLPGLSLDEGDELVHGLDSVLSTRKGESLEALGAHLATRKLSRTTGAMVVGDIPGTLARLGTLAEAPFDGVVPQYSVRPRPLGFDLDVGVQGRPRTTEIVTSLALGAVHAVQRFCQSRNRNDLQIEVRRSEDRTLIEARWPRSFPEQPVSVPISDRPLSRSSQAAESRPSRATVTHGEPGSQRADASVAPAIPRLQTEALKIEAAPEPREAELDDRKPEARPLGVSSLTPTEAPDAERRSLRNAPTRQASGAPPSPPRRSQPRPAPWASARLAGYLGGGMPASPPPQSNPGAPAKRQRKHTAPGTPQAIAGSTPAPQPLNATPSPEADPKLGPWLQVAQDALKPPRAPSSLIPRTARSTKPHRKG